MPRRGAPSPGRLETMPPTPVDSPPGDLYHQRHRTFTAEADRWAGRSKAFSIARLVVFLTGAGCALMAVVQAGGDGSGSAPWLTATGGAALVFFVLLLIHDRVIRRERRHRQLADLNAHALARLAHHWEGLPEPPAPHLAEDLRPATEEDQDFPPLARDLHLFGHASVFHWLAGQLSPPGRSTLARWLLTPAAPEEIRRRQAAVAELAPRLDLRQELERRAAELSEADADVEPFLEWAEDEPWLLRHPGRRAVSYLLPAATLGVLTASIAGPLPGSLVLLALLVNLVASHLMSGPMHRIFDRVAAREAPFQHYAALLEVLESADPCDSPWLQDRLETLQVDGLSAATRMHALQQRVALAESRHSAPLNFILESTLLWNFHVLAHLEGWQQRFGPAARHWLTTLGEIEAAAALARTAFDHPSWAMAEITAPEEAPDAGTPAVYRARGLGHPLIPDERRVTNTVELGPPGTFLLVTGSNMSGKSTLLRAVGINAILAQAGGPACAEELTLPPLALGTSILIEDSLEDGVSFFLAELLRLQEIVEAAREQQREGRTLLYLLDEVLRGTNSRERRLAARRILHHLLDAGALGAVSTHDAALLDEPELTAAAHPVHLKESFHPDETGQAVMTFDYRLREGVATGGNAMRLLALVGLGEEGERVRMEPAPETASGAETNPD